MYNLMTICGISIDDLKDMYNKEKSVKKVAQRLGVSRPTVTKWLRIAGVKTLGHRPNIPPTITMVGEYSPIAKWIKANPGSKLPRSNKEIAKTVGCSEVAVWNYFYRRKKRILRYINSFGDLSQLKIVLTDQNNRSINTIYAESYIIKLNIKSYIVTIRLIIKGRSFECSYPLKEFLNILKTANQSRPIHGEIYSSERSGD